MILTGPLPSRCPFACGEWHTADTSCVPRPVVVDLRTALGDAIDRQQVAIVRAYLDGEASS